MSRVEIHSVDLDRSPDPRGEVLPLSDPEDPRWCGIVALPPFERWPLAPGARTEVYVIRGSLSEGFQEHGAGSFLIRRTDLGIRAGSGGATLLVYRDPSGTEGRDATLPPQELEWHPGGAEGMDVATLTSDSHRVMLVSWRPGTRVEFHTHPKGEEFFVLVGELRDHRGRYPAGAWQRLHPGAGHALQAETGTLLLLRNGHLRA